MTIPGYKDGGAANCRGGAGASAGGVEALEAFFKAMPDDNGMAFVVVTHLDPNRESMLPEILGRATRMPVVNAQDGEPAAAEHVYVLPAGAILTAREGRLQIRGIGALVCERAPIDLFFASLAEDQGEHAIAIVLSGGGTDGTLGLKAIKEHAGLTIAQGANVSRPRFAEMPSSAVTAGFVDLVLPVEEMPERIIAYVRDSAALDMRQSGDALASIHALLRSRTGHDFSLYKDRTFQRRVERRMQVRQSQSLNSYVERLRKETDEVSALFRDLSIGVTDFFRDPAAYQALEALVIPELFDGRGAADEVRVWAPGCATGEEAYSIAILLREQMDTRREVPKVQIFATDIDDEALAMARAARYLPNLLKQMSPARLRRFFISEARAYRVARELRDMCIFSSQSVIRDPPFSRIDLISCRNLLIYLKPESQAQVLPLFHYALRASGYLFLGLSENVSRHSDLFVTVDRKNRIFRRRDLATRPAPVLGQIIGNGSWGGAVAAAARGSPPQRSDLLRAVSGTILERAGRLGPRSGACRNGDGMIAMAQALDGVRVLVIEDDFLVSLLFEDMLAAAGCIVLGPVPRLADALDAAAREHCDVALLDVNLAGEWVFPVAAVLSGRNVPVIFVTGYGSDAIPREFAGQPRIAKPFSAHQLSHAITRAIRTPGERRFGFSEKQV